MSRTLTWNEATVERLISEGYGQGTGVNYKAWFTARSVASGGNTYRIKGQTVPRMYTFLSTEEYLLFLLVDHANNDRIFDIREQFPLPRDITLQAAREAGVPHPKYDGGKIDAVMTLDLLLFESLPDGVRTVGFSSSTKSNLELERTIEKGEILRRACLLIGAECFLVPPRLLDTVRARNLEWMHSGESWSDVGEQDKMALDEVLNWFRRDFLRAQGKSLSKFCDEFEKHHHLEPGAGLDAAKFLLRSEELVTSLTERNIASRSLELFTLTSASTNAQVSGENRVLNR